MLISVLVIVASIAAILFIDYVLIAIVGMLAGAFDASLFFYENIYPYAVAIIISASIAYPITVALLGKNSNSSSKFFSMFHHKHHIGAYKQSA